MSEPVEPIEFPWSREADIAEAFHDSYERLAPEFGQRTSEEIAVPWLEVPENERNLMIATAKDLIDRGIIQ